MILTKEIQIKVTKHNINHLINIGLNVNLKDIILINPNQLSRHSEKKLLVSCDVCGKESILSYVNYMNNYENQNLYTCEKCKYSKTKITKLNKYGDENYTNREKAQKTCISKYGVENVSQSNGVKDKKKETNLKKWGTENVFQNEEIKEISKITRKERYGDEDFRNKEKAMKTCEEKYGVKNPTELQEFLDKRNINNLNKFGVEHYTQTEEYKEQVKITCLEKYGVEYYLQSEDKKEKSRNTMLEKYNCEYPMQNNDIKQKMLLTKIKHGSSIPIEKYSEFQKYKKIVRFLTDKLKKELYDNWNGYDYYDNQYIKENLLLPPNDSNYPTIDHKISSSYGFINNIPPEEIAKIENLCVTKRSINSSKSAKINYNIND